MTPHIMLFAVAQPIVDFGGYTSEIVFELLIFQIYRNNYILL